jgi:dTDP-4-dehydrorhamnose 3,5-epimerase
MEIIRSPIGSFLIKPERLLDSRGYLARTFSADHFSHLGLASSFVQSSLSHSAKAGTVRGLHFQRKPHEEAKLLYVVRGRLFDVAVDIRPESPTFGRWAGHELSAENGHGAFLPEGFAHGFQTWKTIPWFTIRSAPSIRHPAVPAYAMTTPSSVLSGR